MESFAFRLWGYPCVGFGAVLKRGGTLGSLGKHGIMSTLGAPARDWTG